ncbi:hypothetical protein BK133_18865 [Paenibacillus sp. FSL H8-0548]|uniref:family 43 glycosylhydrolase n=1 Tax=Paenibacillus sp. FSL H8-0548 TaxID=1920422 RepID=UPI00096D5D18|nr:family 43 glycosylhydrolase [Paenibacillus sp. FSL H8-0548]OMF28079.1 hypothetical protein BK133_18865 [Paenibacillus sp. FSL H8-0548]
MNIKKNLGVLLIATLIISTFAGIPVFENKVSADPAIESTSYSANFDDGNIDEWTSYISNNATYPGDWSVNANGQYSVADKKNGTAGSPGSKSIVHNTSFDNLIYEGDVAVNGVNSDSSGFLFRVTNVSPTPVPDGFNGYYVSISIDGYSTLSRVVGNNYTFKSLVKVKTGISAGHLKVIAIDNNIRVYVNDMVNPVIDYTDSDGQQITSAGAIGLRTFWGRSTFDNLTVRSIQVAEAPTFTPASGKVFKNPLEVSIASPAADAVIRYTIDGSTPTSSSPVYSGPFTITEQTTVKAYAAKEGVLDSLITSATYFKQDDSLFSNPIVPVGSSGGSADPWVIFKDGFYYYCKSDGDNSIQVAKAERLQDIGIVPRVSVYTPPYGEPYSKEIWAPELHFLNGKWYIYFAADDGKNENHRMYVLESNTDDAQGSYTLKGKITDSTDKWSIDGTVLETEDGMYFVWSGWEGDVNVRQNLYIARMANPWTISGERVLLSTPDKSWELNGDPKINEGPQILKRDGKIFIIYSGSGSWTDDYALGMLTNTDGNVLNPASWTKAGPIFYKTDTAYAPGHASFTKSPDGTEDWVVYHATEKSGDGWANRSVRAQRFTWFGEGSPDLGTPINYGKSLKAPSGTPEVTTYKYEAEGAEMGGAVSVVSRSNASGGKVAGYIDAPNDYVLFNVDVEEAGTYRLTVMNDNGTSGDFAPAKHRVEINGQDKGIITFEKYGWNNFNPATMIVSLDEGVNKVKLSKHVGNAEIDFIQFVLIPTDHMVTHISVKAENNENSIAIDKGTLQMNASVSPSNAMDSYVTWKVTNLDGSATNKATISENGTLSALENGIVQVIASAADGSGIIGAYNVKITNQVRVLRVMPLGASITHGLNVPGGYRIKMWDDIVNAGLRIDFVGSSSNGPASLGDKDHQGQPGWRIEQVDLETKEWMRQSIPDIVLVHVGTNDINQNFDRPGMINRLESLARNILKDLPEDGKLYLSSLMTETNTEWDSAIKVYNNQIVGLVGRLSNEGLPVYFVDMYGAVTLDDIFDGTHPTKTGYDKMSDAWFGAIRGVLEGHNESENVYQNQLTATILEVEKAEASKLEADVDRARLLFDELRAGDKELLEARLAAIIVEDEEDNLYQTQLETTILEVEKAEASKLGADVDRARLLVNELREADKALLEARLAAIVVEDEEENLYQTQLDTAILAVEKAETSKKKADIDHARLLVNELREADKALLEARLAAVVPLEEGGPGGIQNPDPVPTTGGETASSTIEVKSATIGSDKIANAAVSSSVMQKAWEAAKADNAGTKTITLNVAGVEGADTYAIEIPVAELASNELNRQIMIKTSVGTIVVPSHMLQGENISEDSVKIIISLADTTAVKASINDADKVESIGNRPIIEPTIVVGDRTLEWNNLNAPVTISIDYEPTQEELNNSEHITVWYIDSEGNVTAVPNARYVESSGKVTFTTTHFSHYAIVYVNKTFSDIASYGWAKQAIEAMASKGIINGTSQTTYAPGQDITRADFMTLLVNTLELRAKSTSNFDDVKAGVYYYDAVAIAKELGITTGVGNNKFNPTDKISREEMMAFVSRAMKLTKKLSVQGSFTDIVSYTDAGLVSSYAVDDVATLIKAGIIKGSNNMINPRGAATRAEIAVLIYRLYNL